MKSLADIRTNLIAGQFELTRHAFRRAVERNISDNELREIGFNAMIIEDYPDDKYSPSCLILGFTREQRPLHLQVSRMEKDLLTIITMYEPDPDEWEVFEYRR